MLNVYSSGHLLLLPHDPGSLHSSSQTHIRCHSGFASLAATSCLVFRKKKREPLLTSAVIAVRIWLCIQQDMRSAWHPEPTGCSMPLTKLFKPARCCSDRLCDSTCLPTTDTREGKWEVGGSLWVCGDGSCQTSELHLQDIWKCVCRKRARIISLCCVSHT